MEFVVHTTAETGMSIIPMGKIVRESISHADCDVLIGRFMSQNEIYQVTDCGQNQKIGISSSVGGVAMQSL